MEIKLRYTTIDRFSESRSFKSLDGAQRYARRRMGNMFDISEAFGYIVSSDGVGKLTVSGISPAKLMGETCPNCNGEGEKRYHGEPKKEACRFCSGRGFYNPTPTGRADNPNPPLQNITPETLLADQIVRSFTHPVGCICEQCSADYERARRDPRDGE